MSDDEDAFAVFANPDTGALSVTALCNAGAAVAHAGNVATPIKPCAPCNSADALTRTLQLQQSSGSGASAGGAAGFVVVHGGSNVEADDEQAGPRRHVIDPQRVIEEPHSGIRVRRATRSLEQLSVWLAQYPYISFARARALLARHRQGPSYTVEQTCIGVVTRKTDPKAGSRSAHAVLSLWDMTGLSPVANEELSFLLCGSAFAPLYTRLVVGTVVAVANLSVLPPLPKQSTGTPPSSSESLLLRLHDMEQVRVLGLAADLATCAAVSRRSGEQCHNLVNTRRSRTCSYHIADLRRAARGGATTLSQTNKGPVRGEGAASHAAGQTSSPLVTHLAPRAAAPHTAQSVAGSRASRTASAAQPPLRQTGFLAVSGATGLPVQAVGGNATDDAMRGAGVYEGVYRGAALQIQPRLQAGLAPALQASANASHSALTAAVRGGGDGTLSSLMRHATRGRDTLLAAQRQQAAEEQRRLLASALHATPGTSGAATRKRARTALPPPTRAASADQLVAAVKAQCRPLPHGAGPACKPLPSPVPYGSLARRTGLGCTAANRRVERAQLTQAAAESVLVRQVTAALAAESAATTGRAEAWQDTARSTSPHTAPDTHTRSRAVATGGAEDATVAAAAESLTLLGALAGRMQSAQDHLRIAHETHRVDAFLDRQSTQEKAIEALQSITEQTVRAVYCYQCQAWYMKAPSSCTEAQHHTELRSATKRYVQCEHCGYKTFVIGDHVKPWRMLPHCPRCAARCVWNASNAAPECATAPVADSHEAPHPY